MRNNDMVKEEGLKSKTVSGFYWMTILSVAEIIVFFIITATLARLLSPAEHGVMQAALVIISFSELFWQVGVGPAIVQQKNLTQKHIGTAIVFSFILGLLTLTAVYFLSPSLSLLFNNSDLEAVLRVLSLVFIFHSLSVVSESLLQKEMQFKKIALNKLIALVFGYGALGAILAYSGFSYWSLVLATLAQALLKTILMNITCKTKRKITFDFPALKELVIFGGGFTIAKIFNNIALQADNVIVSRTMGTAMLGIYGKAYQMMSVPANLLGGVLDHVLFPAMAKVQDEKEKLVTAFRAGVSAVALVTMPVSIMLWVLTPEIVAIILGKQWVAAIEPIRIFALTLFFRTGYKISDSLCRALGAVYKRAFLQMIYALMVIAGAYIGHYYGLTYVAVGVSIAIVMNFIIMTSLSLSLIKLNWISLIKDLWIVVAMQAVLFLLALMLRELLDPLPMLLMIICLVICIALVYGVLVFFIYRKYMSSKDKEVFLSIYRIACAKLPRRPAQ